MNTIKTHCLAALLACTTLPLQAQTDNTPQLPPLDDTWTLAWHDEFDGSGPLDTLTWNAEHGFVRNEEYQWYQQQNAYRQDGVLVLEARLDSIPNPAYRPGRGIRNWKLSRPYARYSSASVHTRRHYSFQYGRMEVRARIPATCGAWPAIWTLGTQYPWPSNGEIDVMEFYQVDGAPAILANAAYGDDTPNHAIWNSRRIPYTHFLELDRDWGEKFHTWVLDWTPDYLRIWLDGELLNDIDIRNTRNGSIGNFANPFHQPHYILLDLAIGGINGGQPDDNAFPMRYEIDYVRVYQQK
ncbi:MAG: glycoside hydrolase family 16 protein [Prevotellaceae bacterium]|nr:glycoside hydrolase family 16 protein [Prevotellaceae bacterium]